MEELEVLTKEQEQFCRNYTQNYDFFGNATLSYANAYGYDIEAQPDNDAIILLADGREMPQYEYDLIDTDDIKPKVKRTLEESSRTKMENNCASSGSRLRSKVKIQSRCRELLNEFMTDSVIDARLTEIILEGNHADSVRAIQEYNKLRQRIITKVDHTSKGNEIKGNTIVFADFKEQDEGTETDSQ